MPKVVATVVEEKRLEDDLSQQLQKTNQGLIKRPKHMKRGCRKPRDVEALNLHKYRFVTVHIVDQVEKKGETNQQ